MVKETGYTKDETKYSYVEFTGNPDNMLIEIGKFSQNLPITNWNFNADQPCMDPKEIRSLPVVKDPRAYQPNEY